MADEADAYVGLEPQTFAVAANSRVPGVEVVERDSILLRNGGATVILPDKMELLQFPTIPVWIGVGVVTPFPVEVGGREVELDVGAGRIPKFCSTQ